MTTLPELAADLGMKASELTDVEYTELGPIVTTKDGQRLICCHEPDAEGKTGWMFLVAPNSNYRGPFPVFAQVGALPGTAVPAGPSGTFPVVERVVLVEDGEAVVEVSLLGSGWDDAGVLYLELGDLGATQPQAPAVSIEQVVLLDKDQVPTAIHVDPSLVVDSVLFLAEVLTDAGVELRQGEGKIVDVPPTGDGADAGEDDGADEGGPGLPADAPTSAKGLIAWIDGDAVRARAVLDAELASEQPRRTVVAAAEDVLAQPTPEETPNDATSD